MSARRKPGTGPENKRAQKTRAATTPAKPATREAALQSKLGLHVEKNLHMHVAKPAAEQFEKLAAMLRSDWTEGDKFPDALAIAFTNLLGVFQFFDEAGSRSMARAYVHMGVMCSVSLVKFQAEWPDTARSLIEPGVVWPVPIDGTPDGLKSAIRRLRALGVIRKGRSFSYATPEIGVATSLYGYIRSYQDYGWGVWMPREWQAEAFAATIKKLKPLSRERKVIGEWWDIAESMFRSMWGDDFDLRQPFLHYRENNAYSGMNEKVRRSAIRRDIKRNIKQAFTAIAPR